MPGQHPKAKVLEILPHYTLMDCSTLNKVLVHARILAFCYVRWGNSLIQEKTSRLWVDVCTVEEQEC